MTGFCAGVTPLMVRFCEGVLRKSPVWICAISRRAVFIGQPSRSLMRPLSKCRP